MRDLEARKQWNKARHKATYATCKLHYNDYRSLLDTELAQAETLPTDMPWNRWNRAAARARRKTCRKHYNDYRSALDQYLMNAR